MAATARRFNPNSVGLGKRSWPIREPGAKEIQVWQGDSKGIQSRRLPHHSAAKNVAK
jgi:hypothetical protein